MRIAACIILSLVLSAAVVNAELGFDLSAFVGNVDCFEDIVKAGYKFMIIEIQSSKKNFNYEIVHNTLAARKAGINDIDVYLFPDKEKTADQQISYALNYLKSNGVQFNSFWLDIEDEPHWFDTCEENIKFLQDMIDTASKFLKPEQIGLYASARYWSPIMCNTTQFSNYKLWWPRYDNQTSFDSYQPFGGWDLPVMKQHMGTTNISCTDIDTDWRP